MPAATVGRYLPCYKHLQVPAVGTESCEGEVIRFVFLISIITIIIIGAGLLREPGETTPAHTESVKMFENK